MSNTRLPKSWCSRVSELHRTHSKTSPRAISSSRDLEILRLLTKGRNLAQIADALGIGYKTAANNCSQVKAKLRAESTADLIRIAILHGLADRDTGPSPVR